MYGLQSTNTLLKEIKRNKHLGICCSCFLVKHSFSVLQRSERLIIGLPLWGE